MQQYSGKSKEEFVHGVFSSIAHRYDLMNTALTFNLDKYWRRFTVAKTNIAPGGCALDVACGTGMLSIELAKTAGTSGRVVGLDFCENMLDHAVRNVEKTPYKNNIEFLQGNAMELPFEDNTFDCATIGFALRNVPDVNRCIAEMRRVVKPGGRVVSLELAKPSAPVFKQLYYLYFDHLVPLLGKLGVRKDGPYQWLSNSLKIYPHQSVVRDIFTNVGLKNAVYHELTGGIVAVHIGTK